MSGSHHGLTHIGSLLEESPADSGVMAAERRGVAFELAHLVVSAEPAVVFTSLARQCVPAFSDACTITIAETGRSAYRISYPNADPARTAGVGDGAPAVTHSLRTPVRSADDHAPGGFTGEVVHTWDDHLPTAADAVIAQLAVDLAVAAITSERLSVDADRALSTAAQLRTALMTSRQIGAALGVLMSVHKITDAAAFELLRTVSQRTNRKVRDLADEILRTGWLDTDIDAARTPPAADPVGRTALLQVELEATLRRITTSGELDFYSAPVLNDAVDVLLESNPGDSTLDLGGVTFIDAGGIGSIVAFRNTLTAVGATLDIVGASARAHKVFDIVGLDELLTAS